MTDFAFDTPCVLIDLERVENNLSRAQAHANKFDIALRPHIKTHKLSGLAHRQIAHGATGITCQKIGEAEVMANSGLHDIFLPYNILGPSKLIRLKALHDRISIRVTADNLQTVAGYGAHFNGSAHPLDVLVECDTGMGRCGVQKPGDALQLAQAINGLSGLEFGGLMTYPPDGGASGAAHWLRNAVALLEEAGLPAKSVSSGGTPDMWQTPDRVITEYRPGTYIYFDRFQVTQGAATYEDCALNVLATVISRPTENRVIIDAGSKALTSDLLGLSGYGHVVEFPEAEIHRLSEEHGILDLSACAQRPEIGSQISIIPNHVCPVSNLFDVVHLKSPDGRIETVQVAARGRVS